jgi:hypothetical protein
MKRVALAHRAFGFALILGAASFGLPHYVAAAPPGALKALDTDNDGTVDLPEAKAAASKLFDKLDRDHDGTLESPRVERPYGQQGIRRCGWRP